MTGAWHRYWFGPVASVRPYALCKLALILFGFDLWALRAARAASYGLVDFNVAHFRWLDVLLPMPSAGLYFGLILLCGATALLVAFGGHNRGVLAILAVLYSYSWAMSQLDSYQHHYLISSFLLCLACCPRISCDDAAPAAGTARGDAGYTAAVIVILALGLAAAGRWLHTAALPATVVALIVAAVVHARRTTPRPDPAPATCAWGFRLLGAVVAIVYFYTAVAKLDAEWLSGRTLQRIVGMSDAAGRPGPVAALVAWAPDGLWSFVGAAVVVVELVLAAGYLAVGAWAERDNRARDVARVTLWAVALALHLGFAFMGLQIGWFSQYMVVLACVFLLPGRWLRSAATAVTLPATMGRRILDRALSPASGPRAWLLWPAAVVVAAAWLALGRWIDVPGAFVACAALALVPLAAAARVLGGVAPEIAGRLVATAGVVGLLLCGTMIAWPTIYFFHWRLGVERLELQQPAAAYDAFRVAERRLPRRSGRAVESAVNLSRAAMALGRHADAVRHGRAAVDRGPADADAAAALAIAVQAVGDIREAIPVYRHLLSLRPEDARALGNLASILATHPDASVRDGPEAVDLARRSCELTERRHPMALATLAAALAECGRFDEAVATADEALAVAEALGQADVASLVRAHREGYANGRPLHPATRPARRPSG